MKKTVSVAPMMDCTDKHEIYFLSLISKNVHLYTEMIVANAIIRGDFKMGQPITEASLSTSLNISKTPVREALSKLESEGLVVSEKNKGYKVFTAAPPSGGGITLLTSLSILNNFCSFGYLDTVC